MAGNGIGNGSGSPASASLAPPTDTEVAAALEDILNSEPFARVERPSRFLRHVVETAQRGESPILKESLIGVHVFGREASWDPRTDPIVRQEASRLRKRLARYYGSASPEIRIELPIGTYVPVFHRVAGAPAEIPAAEPEAGEEEVQENAPQPIPKSSRRNWLILGLAILSVCGLSLAAWRVFRASPNPPSIVVMPFVNLSTDPSNAYFAAGLTGEINEELVRIGSLKVLSRTAARSFKDKDADVREVGRELNVAYVLGGSVERSGDMVRILAHLDRTADGTQIWAGSYDRAMKDILSVQTELAGAIANNLKLSSGIPFKTRHVPKPEAFDLYLRGWFEVPNLTPAGTARAEEYFRRATEIDPEYAGAWLGLGLAKNNKAPADGRNPTPEELKEVKALWRKALELDPDYASAHGVLAFQMLWSEWDWSGAERELRLATREHQSANTETTYALMAAFRGKFREAEEHIRSAVSYDPANPITLGQQAFIFSLADRPAEALAVNQRILQRYPGNLQAQMGVSGAYLAMGQYQLALESLGALQTKYPPIRFMEVAALARSGRREEALRLIRELETAYENNPAVFRAGFAAAWAALGDQDQAMKWLERSADLHEFQALTIAVAPVYKEMRMKPAFRALVKRIGIE